MKKQIIIIILSFIAGVCFAQGTVEYGSVAYEGAARQNVIAFVEAAGKGDTLALASFIRRGIDVNLRSAENGYTALILAADYGRTEVTGMLLRAGANPNIAMDGDYTAIISAAQFGHTAVVAMLLQAGANPDAKTASRVTALMLASIRGDSEIVEMLLAAGAKPDIRSAYATVDNYFDIDEYGDDSLGGHTAYTLASKYGRGDIAGMLLAAGADPDIQPDNNYDEDDDEYYDDDDYDYDDDDVEPYTVLMQAVYDGGEDEVIRIIDEGKFTFDYALYILSRDGYKNAVKLLLDEVNERAYAEEDVAAFAFIALETAAEHGHTDIVEMLLRNRMVPDAIDDPYTVAFSIAVQQGDEEMVEMLIDNVADFNNAEDWSDFEDHLHNLYSEL